MKTKLIFAAVLLCYMALLQAQPKLENSKIMEHLIDDEYDKITSTIQLINQSYKNARTQRLDSIITTDLNGNVKYRKYFEYDAQLRVSVSQSFLRDNTTQLFKKWGRTEIAYNSNNQFVETISYSYDDFNNIDFGTKKVYGYNGNNQLIEREYHEFDITSQSWVLLGKIAYSYLPSGNFSEIQWLDYSNGQWLNSEKWEYLYNSNDLDSLTLEYIYDSGIWEHEATDRYFYNTNNQLVTIETVRLNPYSGIWELFRKRETIYFTGSNGFSEEFYSNFGNVLELINKTDFHIDQNENLSEIVYYDVDPFYNPTPVLSSREVKTYDNNYPNSTLSVQEYYFEFHHKHKRLAQSSERYNTTTGLWEQENNSIYYWTDLTMTTSNESVPTIENNEVVAYPNPASAFLQFELPEHTVNTTVRLFDITGRTVISQALTEETQINVRDLPTGIYGYLIEQNNKQYSGKVLVKN